MKTKMMKMAKWLGTGSKKKKIALKTLAVLFVATAAALAYNGVTYAANFKNVVQPVVDLISALVNPLLMIVGAGGVIFCIMLGVKYATAEEPQEREKRKQSLKTAIIGYLLIFILVVVLKLSIGPLTEWMESNTVATSAKPTTSQTSNP